MQIIALNALIESRTSACNADETSTPAPTPTPIPTSAPGNGGGGQTPAPTPGSGDEGGTPVPTPVPAALKFNFDGATALALADNIDAASTFRYGEKPLKASSAQGKSNLRKVLSGGGLQEVLESGEATVSQFLVGPNNKLYVLFDSGCVNDSCSQRCVLGAVDTATGVMTCIDDELDYISWDNSANNSVASKKPLQFDSQGNLYYLGNANGMRVLRKYKQETGTREDLINQNIEINGYLVMADGTVLLAGYTSSTSTSWLRKRRLNGSIALVATNFSVDWMSIFPDGRVYISGGYVVHRMRQDSEQLESIAWWNPQPYNFSTSTFYNQSDHSVYASYPQMLHSTNGSVYGLFGWAPNLTLERVFPVPHKLSTSVTQITGIIPVLSNLIITGMNSQGYGQLVMHDTATGDEQNLIGAAELEIYRVQYLQSDNAVQFDAQRFSDGRYVLCTVYLGEGLTMSCTPTGSIKLADFQSLTTPGVRIPAPVTSPTPIPLLETDFTGAKALTGSSKVKADGTVAPALKYSLGRRVPKFTSDNQDNIWVQGAYLTDQDTSKCGLARVDRDNALPQCIYRGNEQVTLTRTRSDGATFFVTWTSTDSSTAYKLYFYEPGGTSSVIANWQNKSPQDALLTSAGTLLLTAGQYSSSFVRNFASDGAYTDLGIEVGYYAKLATLTDGRVLLASGGYDLLTISADGETLNSQKYASYYSQDNNEVGCSGGWSMCSGSYVSKLLSVGSQLFAIGGNNSYDDKTLITYSPGPISAVNFSPAFKPNGVATASANKIFMFGVRNEVSRLLSYDLDTLTEQDLTDDTALNIRSMQYIDGKLYMLGTKSVAGGSGSYCDGFIAVKELSGGTALSKIWSNEWCDSSSALMNSSAPIKF